MAINETATGKDSVAVTGTATGENTLGMLGKGDASGVRGDGKNWNGVTGVSQSTIGGAGVVGANDTGVGVRGESKAQFNPAVYGIHTGPQGRGVIGEATDGTGVVGISTTWVGVYAETNAPADAGASGVLGEGKAGGDGVRGYASGRGKAGVAGFHLTNDGPGIFGKGSPAGVFEGDVEVTGDIRFEGDVEVTGDIRLTGGQDVAEDFDVAEGEAIESGTVMVLGEEGVLHQSHQSYDKRVAGVIAGAGDYKPGIVLDKQQSESDRKPIALMGKVFCKVDADLGPIETGDMLTTSDTPGHAMKAADATQAFGAVIGKALRSLPGGRGLVPILVALQ
ncbi:MAG: hypothetical protein AVDCRST_MAG93-3009 [uncultured Chloroflexia bacterium]|uniref:Uncharacterized protein n=1 Tax=uncultured Chloroflexia bacterium TaxID=1672391 RepID=A0A6J4JIK8_9CHLR|nr:MAG: hypothetical protein AVDCRST_MAG93-3009 [uncultured Chloroflexia bacterium]